ncbi:putative nucleic acid-binding Zn ribbon protein [Nicoletella semolina]|uniref:Putative nucleic acid-binding Zn ribbon protein n=1 Tax=Nicoletella semolina TaxID=271160 RepID=A0A4R2N558_9PAST|nr:Zn-ribbon-containing protein [Nicoletella semolina]MDH2924077.1 hypothetical protein [Nicoletella semolina]TCP15918.1 putative nucleic acid-binding Zn ribbon protein [Nicoletella semolina]
MFRAVAYFSYQDFKQDPVLLINQVVNQWRLNGQIMGREVAVTHRIENAQAQFEVHLCLPEQVSLFNENNNVFVSEALLQAEENGVALEAFEILGRDYQAEETSCTVSEFQLLYTTHLDSCSPLYNGETFQPIPLYNLSDYPELTEKLIKWQENWQACDQLQMNGGVLEMQALAEISEYHSQLSQQGLELAKTVEKITHIPTFYYLYRLGKDVVQEQQRHCPNCQGHWRLAEPLHDIFHFKCDRCRLISNLSWEL